MSRRAAAVICSDAGSPRAFGTDPARMILRSGRFAPSAIPPPTPRRWRVLIILPTVLLACGCAQGAQDDEGTGRGDSGPIPTRRDGATPGRDGGGRDAAIPPSCMDEGHGKTCEAATDLGSVDPSGMAESMPGFLIGAGEEDWFLVGFPSIGAPNMAGGGEPRIELSMNDGEVFRFEVRSTCSATIACGDGRGARDLFSWSFTDDQSAMAAEMSGDMDYSTRDVPWPSPVYVRVYRAVGAADCARYQVRVSR